MVAIFTQNYGLDVFGGEQPPPPFRVLIIRQMIRLPIIRQKISYSSAKI